MDPRIEQLTNQLLEASQKFAAQQRPGVPINYESAEVKQLMSMMTEIRQGLEQELAREKASFQSELEKMQKDLADQEAKAKAPPPPPVRLEDFPLGTITFGFQKQYTPDATKMHEIVDILLKLPKE
jgi:hypothetical protein